MWTDIVLWIVGMGGVSLLVGHYMTRAFIAALNRAAGTDKDDSPWHSVPSWLRRTMVGLVERAFFTTIIAAGLSGTAIALVAWTALKGTLYWISFEDPKRQTNILVAILGSVVSLFWAVLGAVVCDGSLWTWYLGHADF